jgi:hypothetical protein
MHDRTEQSDANVIPMPDTHCPSWCSADHKEQWAKHVSIHCSTWTIPLDDGTGFTHEPESPEVAAVDFDPFHYAPLYLPDRSGAHGRRREDPHPQGVRMTAGSQLVAVPWRYEDIDGDVTSGTNFDVDGETFAVIHDPLRWTGFSDPRRMYTVTVPRDAITREEALLVVERMLAVLSA